MNKPTPAQRLIALLPMGFVTDETLSKLIALEPLHPVLVRLGCGRFICGAQDAQRLMGYATAAGDYVRDVSVLPEQLEAARMAIKHEAASPPCECGAALASWHGDRHGHRTYCCDACWAERLAEAAAAAAQEQAYRQPFNEADCGGAYDGFTVTSDADPGL